MREITCPYCFSVFPHNAVHFRSERVSVGVNPFIPEEYDVVEEFKQNCKDKSSAAYRNSEEWEFFREGNGDDRYKHFWDRHGGTTTEEISQQRASYRRRVLDPTNPEHQRFLKVQNDSPDFQRYLYMVEDFATSITLTSGEICTQRVCPVCHNPLPNQYGKHESRFIAVIGVTGAGKTVYLSQLVYGFDDYVVKVGLAALQTTDSPLKFLRKNPVNTKVPLPGSTPPGSFLQPLFYDLSRLDEYGKTKVYTLVIYDVAGENCDMQKMHSWFAPFIEHMDGVFLLIDPLQFKVIKMLTSEEEAEAKGKPMTVLNAIHNTLTGGKSGKCEIPLAVCISKSDMQDVRDVLDEELNDMLMDDVEPVFSPSGSLLPQFNAKQYNPIAVKLHDFIKENEMALETFINVNYSCYNYFAFTSLGCGVENNIPEGPIIPKRIEEPLLWLLNRFGFVGENEKVVGYGDTCPVCGCEGKRRRLFGDDRIVVTKKNLFGKPKEWEEYEYYCEGCNNYYNLD